ncbi:MAG TPA: hypothetical protein VNU01_05790 [Egibacteraceae bacterium]|nr:hypothetical protein [Egibacteraceae bacterium]
MTIRARALAAVLAVALLPACADNDQDGGDDAVGGAGTSANREDGAANEPGREGYGDGS